MAFFKQDKNEECPVCRGIALNPKSTKKNKHFILNHRDPLFILNLSIFCQYLCLLQSILKNNIVKSFINLTYLMGIKYQRQTLILVVILASLLILGTAQRGGSRSKSSSSSSSHSSSYGHRHYYGSSHRNQNCTTINGTTTCTYAADQPLSWTAIFIFIGIFAVILTIGIISSKKDEERRKTTIDGAMKAFEAKVEEWPSVLDEQQKGAMIDAFMRRSYTMVINIRDKAEKFYCQVKVLDLKRQNDYKYTISMSGSDEVGTSKIKGLLVFSGNGMGFKLSKVYDDRTKAEQTGKFDILLYEGGGNPDRMEGEWAFYGYETSTEYAGNWVMIEI